MGFLTYCREQGWIRSAMTIALVISIFIVAVVTFGYTVQKKMLTKQTELRCTGMAAAITGGMTDALSLGENDRVRGQFSRLKKNLPGLRAFVYDFSNRITFSTEKDLIGKPFSEVLTSDAHRSLNATMLETGQTPGGVVKETLDNRTYLGVLVPSLNSSGCYHCHGDSKKVLGGVAVFVDTQDAEDVIMNSRMLSIAAGGLGIISVTLVIWLIFSRMASRIIRGVEQLRGTSESLAESSRHLKWLSGKIAEGAEDGKTRSLEAASSSRDTAEYISSMAAAAEEVSTQIERVSKDSSDVSERIQSVGNSVSEISVNIGNVAATAEQMSASVTSVASAIEEMYASQNEVARSSGKCANVTSSASMDAKRTSDIVNRLGDAAREIGAVVNLITGIASQTNLLALNAAIEAAGAGEAGKGFAVVANEVKALAKQTAGATEEIKDKVAYMQDNTRDAIKAIEGIAQVINEIDSAMGTIASSVEEQTATTNEISKSVAESADAADSVARNINHAAEKVEDVSISLNKIVALERGVTVSLNDVAEATAGIAVDAAEASRGTHSVSENVGELTSLVEAGAEAAANQMDQAERLSSLAENLINTMKGFKV